MLEKGLMKEIRDVLDKHGWTVFAIITFRSEIQAEFDNWMDLNGFYYRAIDGKHNFLVFFNVEKDGQVGFIVLDKDHYGTGTYIPKNFDNFYQMMINANERWKRRDLQKYFE